MGIARPSFLLAEQRREWSLMIFCARATRGLRRPSLGLLARLGVPVGGRVRKLRAVEDQSAPPLERNKQAWREHIYRPMRAGKDNLTIPF